MDKVMDKVMDKMDKKMDKTGTIKISEQFEPKAEG